MLGVLFLILFLSRTALGQAPDNEWHQLTGNGPSPFFQGAWAGHVVPVDDNTVYMIAGAAGSLHQAPHELVSVPDGRQFITLIKKTYSGGAIWSREMTGVHPNDVELMPDGGVIVVGHFRGTALFRTNATEGISITSKGLDDFFLARYLADGTLAWVRSEGGEDSDGINEVAVDEVGNIGVVGTFGGPAFIPGNVVLSPGMFTGCYAPNGSLQWLRTVMGDPSYGTTITSDKSGHFYVGGSFVGEVVAEGSLLQKEFSHYYDSDILLIKYSTDGRCEWLQRTGGGNHDFLTKIDASGTDGIVIVGVFRYQTRIGPFELHHEYSHYWHDPFVAKLDPQGQWMWANSFPEVVDDWDSHFNIAHLDVDDFTGEIYLGGNFYGTIKVGDTELVGDSDCPGCESGAAYIMRLAPDGFPAWGMEFDGPGHQSITGLKMRQADRGYFTVSDGGYHYATWNGPGWWWWSLTWDSYVFSTDQYFRLSGDARLGRFRPPSAVQMVPPPSKVTAIVGEPVTLRVLASGSNLQYEWFKDGEKIWGEYKSVFTIDAATAEDAGEYRVGVSNVLGGVLSEPIRLGVFVRPEFVTVPDSVRVETGGSVTLQGTATGTPSPALRWIRDLGGAADQAGGTFRLNNVSLFEDGDYTLEAYSTTASNRHHFRVYVDMIPLERSAGFVHDPYRDVVYISSGTNVLRFDLGTRQFLEPMGLSGSLQGLDISADGKLLVVADHEGVGLSNRLHIVHLETGDKQEVLFERVGSEDGFVDVALGADGRVLVTSERKWRSYDPVTREVVTLDHGELSVVARSADHRTMALVDLQMANGRVYRYSVNQTNISGTAVDAALSMSRDVGIERLGRQVAQVSTGKALFYDEDMQLVGTVAGEHAEEGPLGVAYHPQQDLVYVSWMGMGEVRAYRTDTFAEVARYPVSNTPFRPATYANPSGKLRFSRSGDMLLVGLPTGIRYLRLPAQRPVVLIPPTPLVAAGGTAVNMEVTAYSGAPPLRYQWLRNGQEISLATNRVYQIAVMDSAKAGDYQVLVYNDAGGVLTVEVPLTVTKGSPQLSWSNPAAIAYGTSLGSGQLNASAVTGGTFAYDPPAGTRLPVGASHRLQVVFTPADSAAFEMMTNSVFLNVTKKSLTFSTPNVTRQYGLPNPAFNLTVFGLVSGETLADLDALPQISTTATESSTPGSYPITISGGSDDNYAFIYGGTATLTVTKRTVTISLGNLTQAYNGTPRPVSVTITPAGAPVSLTYNGIATVPTAIGNYAVLALINHPNYQGTSASGTLNIFKGSPAITWNTPAPVVVGTALGGAQLNASAPVGGIYSYTPGSGTFLAAGRHPLTLIFTPFDSANYLRATNTVELEVLPLALAEPRFSTANPGEFIFDFNGITGVEYVLEMSPDLVTWSVLKTFTVQSGSALVTDTAALSQQKRFYRIRPKN